MLLARPFAGMLHRKSSATAAGLVANCSTLPHPPRRGVVRAGREGMDRAHRVVPDRRCARSSPLLRSAPPHKMPTAEPSGSSQAFPETLQTLRLKNECVSLNVIHTPLSGAGRSVRVRFCYSIAMVRRRQVERSSETMTMHAIVMMIVVVAEGPSITTRRSSNSRT